MLGQELALHGNSFSVAVPSPEHLSGRYSLGGAIETSGLPSPRQELGQSSETQACSAQL